LRRVMRQSLAALDHRSARCLPVRAAPRLPYHGAVNPIAPKHEVAPLFKVVALILAQARRILRLARPPSSRGCRRGTCSGVPLQSLPTTPVPCLAPTQHTRHACSPGHAAPSPERELPAAAARLCRGAPSPARPRPQQSTQIEPW
jgi:hypothetical protein